MMVWHDEVECAARPGHFILYTVTPLYTHIHPWRACFYYTPQCKRAFNCNLVCFQTVATLVHHFFTADSENLVRAPFCKKSSASIRQTPQPPHGLGLQQR